MGASAFFALARRAITGVSDAAMPFVADIQDGTASAEPGGTHVMTWVTGATVPCRIGQPVSGPSPVAGQVIDDNAWDIALPAATAVRPGQRIIVRGTDAGGAPFSFTFLVTSVRAPLPYEAVRVVRSTRVIAP